MRKIQMTNGLAHVSRFVRIQRAGSALAHCAEPAVPRANVSTQHERGGAIRPALEDVWAPRFLADRVQVQTLNQLQQMVLIRRIAKANPQPLRLWLAWFGI